MIMADTRKPEKAQKKGPKGLKGLELMPQSSSKVLADEEMARRLHEELNGPEANSPAAAATRRNRKAPSFYSPSGDASAADEAAAAPEDEGLKGESQQGVSAGDSRGPERVWASERGSSAGKKAGKKAAANADDLADNASQAGSKSKSQKQAEASSGRPPVTRSSAGEELAQALTSAERKPSLRATRSAGESRLEELPSPKPELSTRDTAEAAAAFGSSSATCDAASDHEQEVNGFKGPPRPLPKVPRMPMCRHEQMWYRARKVEENKTKVLLEFPGVLGLQPVWLAKDSSRIWTGSYKGKDWKHLGDGAWEPKPKEESPFKKPAPSGRGRKRRNPAGFTSEEEEISEEDDDDDGVILKLTKEPTPVAENRPLSAGRKAAEKPAVAEKKVEAAKESSPGLDAAELPLATPKRRGRPPGKKAKREAAAAAAAAAAAEQRSMSEGPKQEEASETPAMASEVAEAGPEPAPPAAAELDTKASLVLDGRRQKQRPAEDGQAEDRIPSSRRPPGFREHHQDTAAQQESPFSAAADKPEEDAAKDRAQTFSEETSAAPAASDPAEDEAVLALLGVNRGGPSGQEAAKEAPRVQEDQALVGSDSKQRAEQHSLVVPGSGLGALAQALANASKKMAQPASSAREGQKAGTEPESHRTKCNGRKRKRPPVKASIPGEATISAAAPPSQAGSGSGNSKSASDTGKLQDDTPSTSNNASERGGAETWRAAFKEKHRRRLEELEAEEEAAESQELLSEDAQEPVEEPSKRPVRAIRAPRAVNTDRSDAPGTRSSRDLEGGSPPPTARRGGRGRGRWANHVKRGNGRGVRPTAPTPSPQDTPRGNKTGGRGRRGGRWGNRQQHAAKPEPDLEVVDERMQTDLRVEAFRSIVDALEKKAAGLPFAGFPAPLSQAVGDGAHPCSAILEAPVEKFGECTHAHANTDGWSFRMPAPPVPLFK